MNLDLSLMLGLPLVNTVLGAVFAVLNLVLGALPF